MTTVMRRVLLLSAGLAGAVLSDVVPKQARDQPGCVSASGAAGARLWHDPAKRFEVALPSGSPLGEASLREHAIAWHPQKKKFYLVADVVPLDSPHHPNTYDTELYLWSSPDLTAWTFHGIAVPKGVPGKTYDGYGVASPAGMACHRGKLWVPFSARRTPQFIRRSIGLAWSSDDPERLPWSKTAAPVSDLDGEDDDPAVVAVERDDRLHLYHRTTAGGYRIVHSASADPERPGSWPKACPVTVRTPDVRAQELTGAAYSQGWIHLFVIEHLLPSGLKIGHFAAREPDAIFPYADPARRFVEGQPSNIAYGGHLTPILQGGELIGLSWTVGQAGKRYGIEGHAASWQACGVMTGATCHGETCVADFEGDTYGGWKAAGTAFGAGPAKGTLPGQMQVRGFLGKGLVNSFNGGDGATGTLTSPPFTIDRKHLAFLIGGGGWKERTCMNLLVEGKVVRTAVGPNVVPGGSEELGPGSWDVSDLIGKQAQIQIVDNEKGGWGHINVDQIRLCDAPPSQPQLNVTRVFAADKRWLLLPVKNGGPACKVEVRAGAEVLRFFDIELAEGEPDWWAPLDVWSMGQAETPVPQGAAGADACPAALRGKTLTLWANKLPAGSRGLERARLADEAYPREGLYREALRPQLHFSPARGWNNDPNGLVFYTGEYHLFFQHNPYGVNWGNMHWGHAVSKDLVHWAELGEVLYPDALGPMFSGSAVVDHANTSGFGKDGKVPLVLIYTAAGNPATQCIAYSLDGRRFTKYDGNPVVKNIAGGNRDPKVFWHAPTRRWIMALYVARPERRHTVELLASTDLREWRALSAVPGDEDGGRYLYECPDLFELPVAGSGNKRWVLFGADGQYAVGAFDGTAFAAEAGRLRGHWGPACYAAQTFSDMPDGRRVLIGWLQAPSPNMPFNQCMSLPQELGLARADAGVRLTRAPVKELEGLRERTQVFGPVDVSPGSGNPLAGFEAELCELRLKGDVSADAVVTVTLRGVPLRYDAAKAELTVGAHVAPWPLSGGRLGLIVYLDRTCVEVFSEDGLLYAPVAVIPQADARKATLTVEEGTARGMAGEVHALRSIWK